MTARRWALVAMGVLAWAPGCTRRCNDGRLFLTVTLPGDVAAKTQQLSVRLTVADAVRVAPPVAWRGHAGSNSFDVDFASGYQAGRVVTVSAVALDDGGAPVGYSERGELTLASGCDALTLAVPAAPALHLVAGALGGAGSADGVGRDARFRGPTGLALDGAQLYVADSSDEAVRVIDLGTAAVSTAEGLLGPNGRVEIGTPQSLAIDAGVVYVSSFYSNVIRAFDVARAQVATLAGGDGLFGYQDGAAKDARFNYPAGLVADGMGAIYVADSGNGTIRKLTLNAGQVAVTTIAGNPGHNDDLDGVGGAAHLAYPHTLVRDGNRLYVVERADPADGFKCSVGCRVRRVTLDDPSGVRVDTVTASGAALANPHGLVKDGDDLFIADSGSSTLRRLPAAGGEAVVFAGALNDFRSNDGDALMAARFSNPEALAVDANHDLYIADGGNHVVRKLTRATGLVTTVAGAVEQTGAPGGAGPPRFAHPQAVASDGTGAVYVADYDNGVVRKLAFSPGTATATVTCFPDARCATPPFGPPTAVAVDANGDTVYVADGDSVFAFGPDGGVRATFVGGAGDNLASPTGIAVDARGTVYIADSSNHVIRRVDRGQDGKQTMTTWRGAMKMPGGDDDLSGGGAPRFNLPSGLVIDGNTLYVADRGNDTVRAIDLTTAAVTTPFGAAAQPGSVDDIGTKARFAGPRGLALDGRGNLYVADADNHALRRIALGSGRVSTWAGSAGVARVRPGALPAELNRPFGVTVLPDGMVVLADGNENAILAVR